MTGQQQGGGGQSGQQQQDQQMQQELAKLNPDQRRQFDEQKRQHPNKSDREILDQVKQAQR